MGRARRYCKYPLTLPALCMPYLDPVSAAGELFPFLDPGDLTDGDVRLQLNELRHAQPELGFSPCYAFDICDARNQTVVGSIRLRMGQTEDLRLYAGHIGYEVFPQHRGHRFAARAVRILLPLALRHGMNEVWITCDPVNAASRRTCELAGGVFVEIVDLPSHLDMYREGERQKCRYRIDLSTSADRKLTKL